jgi:hypothetical protein
VKAGVASFRNACALEPSQSSLDIERTSRARQVNVHAIMKQRITYVVKDPDSFTPELLEVKKDGSKDSLVINGLQAAKEHRITLGLDELPSEV